MTEKQVRFADLLTLHVSNTVQKQFLHETLSTQTLRAIRDCVHKTISEIFERSNYTLSSQALNWVGNQYFKSIQVGSNEGMQSINDMVVINDYKLSEMSFCDIQLMRNLFSETAMSAELEAEYFRRNAS